MEENIDFVNTSTIEKEKSKIGWGVLGFFIPIVGLILLFIWMKTKKKAAIAAGIGALISFILCLICLIILFTTDFELLQKVGIVSNEKTKTNELDAKFPRTKDCTGKITKGYNKYEYIMETTEESNDCKSVTYNFKNNFKIKKDYYHNEDGTYSFKIRINNNSKETFDLIDNTVYILKNTMVIGEWGSSTVTTSLINSSGDKYFSFNNLDGKDDKKYEINNNKELVITAIIYGLDGEDYLGGINNERERTCELSLDEVANRYGLSMDDDIETTYTYKLNDNGLFDIDNPTKETLRTIRFAYEEYCN